MTDWGPEYTVEKTHTGGGILFQDGRKGSIAFFYLFKDAARIAAICNAFSDNDTTAKLHRYKNRHNARKRQEAREATDG